MDVRNRPVRARGARRSHAFFLRSGGARLDSITSWRQFKTENREDEDGTNRTDLYFDTNNREKNGSFYQELRLSGASDTRDWLVGVSFFDENANQVSDTFAFTDSINTTLSNVGFGTPFTDLEGALQFFGVPTTVLGLGWREAIFSGFQFDLVFDMNNFSTIACDNGVNVAEGVECVIDSSFDDISPRGVVDYRLTDNVLVFASYAQGYKASGFNSVQPDSRFSNEDVDNYEAGFKSSFPDLGLTLNLSAFHYICNNRQSIRLTAPPGGTIPQYVTDTSDEKAWGADMQALFTPNEGPATFFFNAQYIDATYKSAFTGAGADLSGEPTGIPKWNLAFGARVGADVDFGGRIELQVAHSYRGACRSNSTSVGQGSCGGDFPNFRVGAAQNRTDLRARWISPGEKLELGLFANNVFDKRYVDGVNNITWETLGTPFASLTSPRFWGGDIRVNF